MKLLQIITSRYLSGLALTLFANVSLAQKAEDSGYFIQQDSDIAINQSGPHKGGGETTGFPFFSDVPAMDLVFKKRILHPGSAIGYHEQHKDEIYYVISGAGELTMNGTTSEVGPGTAILTRPGNSHGLRQTGDEDLVIFIVYRK
ncbi:cupin domain-containing protein [Microbulbifer mangrovi]|uniref:cupin domain-containing protein n=1 Tax=Microbulbifer mangrovi TaxID=927787 RepID=UPI0009909927|nr:cupin domain-containing protein [Microbulbifer mangrovi]